MLERIFQNLLRKYTADENLISNLWQEIKTSYSSKSRHYHNLGHLTHILTELEPIKADVEDLDTLLFSIFYHDIVYKVGQTDNEHKSAMLFKKRISQTHFQQIDKCVEQIEQTKAHAPSNSSDTNILLDLDLAILGAPPETYQAYCQNIRKEFRIYPDLIFKKGRKKVLLQFLNSKSIYKTHYFIGKYEARARKNLAAEIQQLS